MTQQEQSFGEINHEEPSSSYTGYTPSDGYSSQSLESGQQLSGNTINKGLTSNQRLVLAIVSLVLLLVMLLALTLIIAITSPGLLLPIVVISLVFFFTAIIHINNLFSHKNKSLH